MRFLTCGNSSVVEHDLAKVGVASSNLVSRSIIIINCDFIHYARMAKLVDAGDLKSPGSNTVPVQVRLRAPLIWKINWCHRQVVRPQPAKLLSPVQIWVAPPVLYTYKTHVDLWQSWSNAPVLKTGEGHTSQSSNLWGSTTYHLFSHYIIKYNIYLI